MSYTRLFHLIARKIKVESAIARNSLFLMLAEVVRVGVSFYLSVRLGRYLQPEGQGVFRFIVNYTILFAVLAEAGVSRVVVRAISRSPRSELNSYYTTLVYARILTTFTALAALTLSLFVLPASRVSGEVKFLTFVYMFSQFFQAWRKNVEAIWQATQELHYHAAFVIANRVFTLAVVLTAISRGASLATIVYLYVLGDLLDAAISTWYLHRRSVTIRLPALWQSALKLIYEGIPFALQSYAQQLRYYFDVILIKFLVPDAAVRADREIGLYGSAVPFVLSLQFVPMSIAGSIYPELSQRYKHNRPLFESLARRSLTLLFLLGTSLAVGIYFGRELIMMSTFGKSFRDAIPMLGILAWEIPFFFLNIVSIVIFAACDKQNALTAVNTAATVLKLVLCRILIPSLGGIGAAWASVVAELSCALVLGTLLWQAAPRAIPLKSFALILVVQATFCGLGITVQHNPVAIAVLILVELIVSSALLYLFYRRKLSLE
jgi:O-antigen/teichoic acid export membrane protein